MCEMCELIDKLGEEIRALGLLMKVEPSDEDYEAAAKVLSERDSELDPSQLKELGPRGITELLAVRCANIASATYRNHPPLSLIMAGWAEHVLQVEMEIGAIGVQIVDGRDFFKSLGISTDDSSDNPIFH